MVLASGEQVCCDAYIVEGRVEVNEALLTGESDPNHTLLSGSSVISGRCLARVIHVGSENYAQQIAEEVKQHKAMQSDLMRSMRKVTKITCIFLLPFGLLLLYETFILRNNNFQEGILSISAA